jgi:hypothetical protein
MTDYAPVYENGSLPFTMTASVAVVGGTIVAHTGVGTVGPAGAGSGLFVGVAAHDAAINARVSIWPLPGLVHEVVSTSGITTGAAVQTGATGTGETGTLATLAAAGTLVGTALSTATAGLKFRFLGR